MWERNTRPPKRLTTNSTKKEAWPWNQETIQHYFVVVSFESMKDMIYKISPKKKSLVFYLIKSSIIIIVVFASFFGHCSGRMLCKLCSVITDDNKITYYDLFFLLWYFFAFFFFFFNIAFFFFQWIYISIIRSTDISIANSNSSNNNNQRKRYRYLNI